MKTAEVAYYRSEEHDIWLGRRRDGVLVMEGFVKDGDDLKYLVDTPEDASLRTALESLKHYGRKVQRPYLLGDGCDGSITVPVLALYLNFCKRHKLDAATLYAEAYPGDKGLDEGHHLRRVAGGTHSPQMDSSVLWGVAQESHRSQLSHAKKRR